MGIYAESKLGASAIIDLAMVEQSVPAWNDVTYAVTST